MDLDEDRPRRKPGRPRKVSTITKQEYIDDVEDDAGPKDESFSGLFDEATLKQIIKVRVIRKEPNEGTVGYLEDPLLGEAEIFERWGGSSYLLQAIDAKGLVKKTAMVKIAGDPVFVSSTAEMQWRRSRGLPMVAAPAAVAADKGMSMQDLLMFMQQQDQGRRTEEREHQERLRKLELEAADKARKDDEERERRRRLDDEEREQRRRREQQESETRSQQFMQQTIQMLQQSSTQALQFVKATSAEHGGTGGAPIMEAVKMVVAIKEAFANDAPSDGEADPLSMVIKHGGEWLQGLGGAISGAIREVKGNGAAPPVAALPAMPAAALPVDHPLMSKVGVLASKLAAKGHDPEAAMAAIIDKVIGDVDKLPSRGQPAAPPSGPVPFVQSGVGVAGGPPVAPPGSELHPAAVLPKPPAAPRRVVRMQFGAGN